MAEWLRVKDDLLAGRTPRPRDDRRLTLTELANQFLTFKTHMVRTGELSQRSFNDYYATCERVLRVLGTILGYADDSMAATYREEMSDNRLQDVSDHVRSWLFNDRATAGGDGHQDAEQAPTANPLAVAIDRARAAIEATAGPTRTALESVWLPEIDLAQAGETDVGERIMRVWGDNLLTDPA